MMQSLQIQNCMYKKKKNLRAVSKKTIHNQEEHDNANAHTDTHTDGCKGTANGFDLETDKML